MPPNRPTDFDGTANRIAIATVIWTHVVRLATVLDRLRERFTGRVAALVRGETRRSTGRGADDTAPASGHGGVNRWLSSLGGLTPPRTSLGRATTAPFLRPTVTSLVALVALTGIAAAQSSTGGVCGTPAIALFEWAARTGAGIMFLGGLLYGGFTLGRSVISRNPEVASRHRRNGGISLLAGPIFGLVIVFGKQGAAAAGFTVAECATLTPWF